MSFVITQVSQASPERCAIDTSRGVAVAGHSFGAYTTLALCGARPILRHLLPPVDGEYADDLADPRVCVGIAMSPQGPGCSRFDEGSYATIDRPVMCFSGTLDVQLSADGTVQEPKVRKEAFRCMPPSTDEAKKKYFLWLENADHMAFCTVNSFWLTPSEARDDTMGIVYAMMIAFCDTHLKSDPAERSSGQALLTERHARLFCGKVVTQLEFSEK